MVAELHLLELLLVHLELPGHFGLLLLLLAVPAALLAVGLLAALAEDRHVAVQEGEELGLVLFGVVPGRLEVGGDHLVLPVFLGSLSEEFIPTVRAVAVLPRRVEPRNLLLQSLRTVVAFGFERLQLPGARRIQQLIIIGQVQPIAGQLRLLGEGLAQPIPTVRHHQSANILVMLERHLPQDLVVDVARSGLHILVAARALLEFAEGVSFVAGLAFRGGLTQT